MSKMKEFGTSRTPSAANSPSRGPGVRPPNPHCRGIARKLSLIIAETNIEVVDLWQWSRQVSGTRCPGTTGCERAAARYRSRRDRCGAGVGAVEAILEQQSIGPRAKKSLFECGQPHSQVSVRVSSRVPRHGGLAQHNQQFHQG